MSKKLILSACTATMVMLSGCATVADIAGANSATLNAQAVQGFNQTVTEAQANKTYDTSSQTYKRINKVFYDLKPFADQLNQTGSKFDWQLAVLKSNEVNAYVAPGGKVVFYTGIVDRLNLSNPEIAAIMGHEMVHALEEHAKQKIGAQALTDMALSIGLSYAGVGELGTAAAQFGSQIGIGLPYSRNLESRADEGGLYLMARAGYNPEAAITLWQKMAQLDGSGGMSFLSTHPSNTQRIEAMRKNLAKAQGFYNQSVKK